MDWVRVISPKIKEQERAPTRISKDGARIVASYRADDQGVFHSKAATTPERIHLAGSIKNNRRSNGASSTADGIANVYLSSQHRYKLPGDKHTFSNYDECRPY